jgi:hypothetical protein
MKYKLVWATAHNCWIEVWPFNTKEEAENCRRKEKS